MGLHFADLFEHIGDAFPSGPAIVHASADSTTRVCTSTTQRLTWSEYELAAAKFANFLLDLGLAPGAKIGLYLYNGPEYLIAQYGAFKQRVVPINLNYRYVARELDYLIDNADLDVVIFHRSLGDRIAQVQSLRNAKRVRAWVQVDDRADRDAVSVVGSLRWNDILASQIPAPRLPRSEDDHYMLYTGGTTGMPKGVVFRMGDIVARMFTGYFYRGWTVPTTEGEAVAQAKAHAEAGDRRVSLVGCPLMHGTGMWLGAFYAHLMGGTTVTLAQRTFDADQLWAVAQAEQVDAITIVGDSFAVPMLKALTTAHVRGTPYEVDALRILQSSGVMLSAETQAGLLSHLDIRIVDSMGSTEGGMARRIATRDTPIETAAFEILPGTKLITDDGRIVVAGSGEIGRIAASAVVPLEYYKDPEKSAQTFIAVDGVRHAVAGDYATIDDKGRLVLLGRGSNCINTAGEKVFPEEVEEALKRHPEVVDSLVVGVADDGTFGHIVAAVVRLVEGSALHTDDLKIHLRNELAGYKVPKHIKVVPNVERTPAGKADYPWAQRLFVAP